MPEGYRMELRAALGEVARANTAFAAFAQAQGLPAGVRRAVSVALDELLANTVTHGLGHRADGAATVEVALTGDRLVLTLSDNGVPYDPFGRETPDTSLSVEDRPIGGLGVHLVRELMDAVDYARRGDRNVITLTKSLGERGTTHHHGDRTMEITTRTQGEVTIVALAGSLDSASSPQAQQAMDAVLASGVRKMAVDFGTLDYISSAGLRVLLGAAKQLNAKGGALRMFGLNDSVREVFEISGFSKILPTFAKEADALTGF